MSSIAEMHVVSRIAEDRDDVELSVVMPCLNEAATVGICVKKAIDALERHGIRGEVIVADNGSTDGSQQIARDYGARVVPVETRGYGSALQGGIAAARGQFVLMGDADDTYDFAQLDEFVAKLREGYDLVMGNRFRGKILPGAMPPLHRYLGKSRSDGIGAAVLQKSRGRFSLRPARVSQGCDRAARAADTGNGICQRNGGEGHGLRFARHGNSNDACSRPPRPRAASAHLARWLAASAFSFVVQPALAVSLSRDCAVRSWNRGERVLLPGPRRIGNVVFDVHTLLFAAMAILIGFQSIVFATFTKIFAISEGLLPEDPRLTRMFRYVTLEVGLVAGVLLILAGAGAWVLGLEYWRIRQFGPLDPEKTLRIVIPGVVCFTLGFQVILSSFFLSVLGMSRR